MAITIEPTGYEPVPAKNYNAVCMGVWDVGMQPGKDFNTGEPTMQHQIVFGFEIPVLIKDGDFKGKRRLLFAPLNAVWGDKAKLVEYLQKWGIDIPKTYQEKKKFDFSELIGRPAMINVALTEKGKNKIIGISSLPDELLDKAMKVETASDYIPGFIKSMLSKQVKPEDTSKPTHGDAMAGKKLDTEKDFYKDTGFDDRAVDPNMDEPGY